MTRTRFASRNVIWVALRCQVATPRKRSASAHGGTATTPFGMSLIEHFAWLISPVTAASKIVGGGGRGAFGSSRIVSDATAAEASVSITKIQSRFANTGVSNLTLRQRGECKRIIHWMCCGTSRVPPPHRIDASLNQEFQLPIGAGSGRMRETLESEDSGGKSCRRTARTGCATSCFVRRPP